MPIEHVLVLTETTFRERDYVRFGLNRLSRQFQVHILDCTAWLRPAFWEKYADLRHECEGYQSIANVDDFTRAIQPFGRQTVAFDYLFSGGVHRQLRRALRSKGVLRSVIFSSLLPRVRHSGVGGVRDLLRILRDNSLCCYYDLRCALSPFLTLPPSIPDIAIISGRTAFEYPKAHAPIKVFGHSFDYDTYLQQKNVNIDVVRPYAVFLDQNLAFHTDTLVTGRKAQVTESAYFSSLKCYFDAFEKQTGLEVVVAAQPRTQYVDPEPYFGQRRVINGKSSELVRDASLVLAHYSAAVSFPVLWRKPILFLTTQELHATWIQPYINAFSRLLCALQINIDTPPFPVVPSLSSLVVSEDAYAAYQEMHIKMPGTPESPVWEVVADYLCGKPN